MRRIAFGWMVLAVSAANAQTDLDRQNVVWTTPSQNASGSMPIGNGEVGLNVWVEENGDLLFYVSRTDTWSEASRLLKLGRVRVKLTPNPFQKGKNFRQELVLRDGRISIRAGNVDLNIFVDAKKPVIHMTGQWMGETKAEATLETWRAERRQLKGPELASSWTMQDAPIPIWESADVISKDGEAQILYHRNESTIVPFTLQHQDLAQFANLVKDPLKDRHFGLRLEQKQVQGGFQAAIAAESLQTPDTPKFLNLLKSQIQESKVADAAKRTLSWWHEFWDRSYIFVEGDRPPVLPESKHKLRVGFDSNSENRFLGTIRNAVVYDRPLSAAEVAQLKTLQPANPVISQANQGRKKLVSKALETPDPGTFFETEEAAPFSLKGGFTAAALITPKKPTGRIFDMLTAGQSDGFLFDTHPGYALRAVIGDKTVTVPGILKEGEAAHVALVATSAGGIRIYKDGELVHETKEDLAESKVTQAYTLQRYMNAIGGRGNYPIKFNGSIFTVEPTYLGQDFNPDWRRWGDCYWWQNTRLPYYAMPAAGDFDLMLPLFKMYKEITPISAARANHYYQAKGAYYPETVTIFGTYANKDYGWDRNGLKSNEVQCPWWMYAWNQSLELLDLMLAYQAENPAAQKAFSDTQLEPMLQQSGDYFWSRFMPASGPAILKLTPTQSVETYWYDVVNDTPSLAGLHSIRRQVMERFPELKATSAWFGPNGSGVALNGERRPIIPAIPLKDGKIAPAESYKDQRNNVENPEFYAIWPFRLYGVGRPDLEMAQKTFRERIEKASNGWQYDGQVAALSGLTEDAKNALLGKVRNSNSAFRWPASWGPNYDWLPDQCHGSNIMITLQTMCLQEVGDKLHVLPAFPKEWNVKFKLHASRGAVVTAEYEAGKLKRASVTPTSRMKDLVLR